MTDTANNDQPQQTEPSGSGSGRPWRSQLVACKQARDARSTCLDESPRPAAAVSCAAPVPDLPLPTSRMLHARDVRPSPRKDWPASMKHLGFGSTVARSPMIMPVMSWLPCQVEGAGAGTQQGSEGQLHERQLYSMGRVTHAANCTYFLPEHRRVSFTSSDRSITMKQQPKHKQVQAVLSCYSLR